MSTVMPPEGAAGAPRGGKLFKLALSVVYVYLFLLAIALMGMAFKMMGKDFSTALIETTSSPIVGLMIGMLATAIVQSSSATTSVVVGLASAGAIDPSHAIPIIMGANIGTTVTNTIVALTAIRRKEEFQRSFAAATMHDFFNLMTLAVLFPLELATGYLRHTANALSDLLVGREAIEFDSPVKAITKPVAKDIVHTLEGFGWTDQIVAIVAVALALAVLFFSLSRLPALLRELFVAGSESRFSARVRGGGMAALGVGILVTVLVQSSSITTSLLIPLVGAGVLSLRAAFPVTLGANVGTTVTALLASTAGTHDGVTIALAHLIFNLSGILLIWPVPALRDVPIKLATKLAAVAVQSSGMAIAYVFALFFGVPGLIVFLTRTFGG